MASILFSVIALVVCCKCVIGNNCEALKPQGFVPCSDNLNLCCCTNWKTYAICDYFERNRTDLPSSLPTTITSLLVVNNSLPIVSRNTFNNLKASTIKKLGLKSDHIINVTEDAFLDFKVLYQLDLSMNENLNITSLSSALNSLPNGKRFRFYFKSIGMTNISEDFLKHLYHRKVEEIDLSGNRFNVLNFSPFRKMIHLKNLTISNSGICNITTDIGTSKLEELDLRYNKFGGLAISFCRKDGNLTIFSNLKKLHLQANSLTGFFYKKWDCLKRLRYLDISQNLIVTLHKNMFAELASLTELRLSYNNGRIKEIEDFSFNSSRLEHLILDGNEINFKSTMTNIFIASPNLKILSLSENNFNNIEDSKIISVFSPLKNLTTLFVRKANMRLPDGLLTVIPNLETLYIDENGIKSLGVSLKNTRNLKVVSVMNNHIRIVDKISFNGYSMGSVQDLNLAFNPFECTCENLWFRNAIDSHGKIGHINLKGWPVFYRCTTEGHAQNNTLFSHYKPTELSCQNNLLIALICSLSFIVLSSITISLVYRYRWYLTYWAYKSKSRRANPERQPLLTNEDDTTRHDVVYDAYVIYDSADARFVHHDFRLLMEEKFGYKLHIWERDASAGETKVIVVADAMYASKYVVAVISGDVLENSWLQFQINIALDRQIDLKRDFLILILLENIDYNKLSKFWCVMFTRLISTEWCSGENNVKKNVFEQQILRYFGKKTRET